VRGMAGLGCWPSWRRSRQRDAVAVTAYAPLGLPERAIRAEWKRWALQAYRVGRAIRWRERDVHAWIDAHPAA